MNHRAALVFLVLSLFSLEGKKSGRLRDSGNSYMNQPSSTQYILSTSILALSDQFFTHMQKDFIPNVFKYIMNHSRSLNFP
jgi:hypothetical protein